MGLDIRAEVGPIAWAAPEEEGGSPVLVVWLDPGRLTLAIPERPRGVAHLVQFLRQLSLEAGRFADELQGQHVRQGDG